MKEYVDIARDRVEGMSRQGMGMGLMVCVCVCCGWRGEGGGADEGTEKAVDFHSR